MPLRSMPPSRACVARRGRWASKWLDRFLCGSGALPRWTAEGGCPYVSFVSRKHHGSSDERSSGGRRGENEEVRKEYRKGAESSRAAVLHAAGSGSTSAESKKIG